ncbi:MAG: fluoride efflux transporter CrcB [Verrucomicrobiae bacterium]|nr:fluoride efflux transporter CrcB [Verrucomicrobiae bacterium]NNJ86385.1 fluoride efflux transporter CrcB [Akkermansiaceae bacterium]
MNLLYIFIGGGLGAVSRFGLSAGIQSVAEHTRLHRFPVGILACNLLGSFLIGCIFGYIASRGNQHPAWLHPLAITGFLGAFTTFSTFAMDTQKLFSSSPLLALINILASVIGTLVAVWLGFKLCNH